MVPEVTITSREGQIKTLNLPVGGSLMEALRDVGYDEIIAICGGNCSCATCHVYIDFAKSDDLKEKSEDEQALLESLTHLRSNSRLACQVEVDMFLEGSGIIIPPEE